MLICEKTKLKNIRWKKLVDGASRLVIGGTHKGKLGIVRDINTRKSGHVTITVVQKSGFRFKTLAKNTEINKLPPFKDR